MDFTYVTPHLKKISPQVLAVGELGKKICAQPEFSHSGFNISYAESATDVFKRLATSDFAAILLCYQVLEENDFKTLKQLRSLSGLVPLILVTQKPMDQDHEVIAYESGATDIVCAKISPRILVTKLKYYLDLQVAKDIQLHWQDDLMSTHRAVEQSEEKLKFALSSANMGMWTVALPSGHVVLSEEARSIFGFAKTYDTSDAAIDEFIHPDFREQAREVLADAIASGSLYNDEYQIIRPDGEIRWINARGRARYDFRGQPYQLSGLIWDVTARKNAEINLAALETRFSRSAEATDLGVWYCNLPFSDLIWNKEVKGHFFLPPDAYVTIETFYEIIHPEDREPARLAIETSIQNKTPYDVVYRTVNPENPNDIKYIRAIGWTDYNDAGEAIRFDGITLDVSQQRAYEEDLRQAKEAAEKANELKSSFLANMSHEIRTPLGAMIGFADLLKDETISDEERLSYANVITRNGHQLSHIINDILDISKVESGQFTVENLETDPRAVTEEVMSLLSLNAKEKGIKLSLTVKDNVPAKIVTDPLRLRQILTNIIGNAVKFTIEGDVKVTLLAEKNESGRAAVGIRVEDTGEGIALEDQKKLFQVFCQADNSVTRKFGGTGLGLALSRKLARALNGDVVLEKSVKGKGSSFLITLTSGTLSRNTAEESARKNESGMATDISGVRVLLVEDTPDNQELISKVLTEQNATVDLASDGMLGIEKALQGNYDLVLMDLQMPVMDGYTATQKLRERGFEKPIIALSAHAMNEVRLECLNVGCDDYLTKPIDFDQLIKFVGQYSGKN
ncbi:hypothetical protein AZI86_00365 [Bdellovibrio bacteriovorus]|uniref:histidine kinase n=1 Tax=Bdellovibrio bacteriovorus TaxID=959 RepID=A0A150WMQ6_BDEBC|nr:response regulator [Bdellovibrio bacteriovorus]KYG65569.1 hypothetical protein AZI86_00365 [Bdellovibrio bacteriovorus]